MNILGFFFMRKHYISKKKFAKILLKNFCKLFSWKQSLKKFRNEIKILVLKSTIFLH